MIAITKQSNYPPESKRPFGSRKATMMTPIVLEYQPLPLFPGKMGCDGGSIPKRSELVRTKGGSTKKDAQEQAKLNIWKYCSLSNEPLRPPVVVCAQGKLYNKESILKLLIDRSVFVHDTCPHITCLKDLKTLQLTPNPSFDERDPASCPFACPITGKIMNSSSRFVYLKTCGCVMSEAALHEIKSDKCLKCGKASSKAVRINPEKSLDPFPIKRANEDGRTGAVGNLEKKAKAPSSSSSLSNRTLAIEEMKAAVGEVLSLKKTKSVASLYSN